MKPNAKCWRFFNRRVDRHQIFAVCKVCGTEYRYSGATTTLMKHSRQHLSTDSESVNSSAQSNIKSFLEKSSNRMSDGAIDDLLMKFFASSYCPLRAIENPFFVKAFKSLGYTPPSSKTLMRKIEDMSSAVRTSQNEALESASHIALTCGVWSTQNSTLSVLGVTAHYFPADSFERKDAFLSLIPLEGSHSSETLREKLLTSLPVNCLEKVKTIVTDGSPSMSRMCKILEKKNVHCLADKINLCIKQALSFMPLSKHLADIRIFLNKLKRSGRLKEKCKMLCHQHSINFSDPTSDVPFQWNSTFTMLSHFLKMKKVYDQVMLEEGTACFSSNEESYLHHVVDVLKIFEELSRQASLRQESVGLFLGMRQVLRTCLSQFELKSEFEELVTIIQAIQTAVTAQFDELVHDEDFRIATFFDPRFAWLNTVFDINDWTAIQEKIADRDRNPTHAANASDDSIWAELYTNSETADNRLNVELMHYKMAVSRRRPTTSNSICLWWSEHSGVLPLLSSMAKEYIVIPPGSVDCERVLSGLEEHFDSKRRSLLTIRTIRNYLTIAMSEDNTLKGSWTELFTVAELDDTADSDYSEEL